MGAVFPPGRKARLAVTIITYGFAIILAWLLARRYLANSRQM